MIHGGDIYSWDRQMLDCSANVNPLGMPDGVKQAFLHSLDGCIHYPDPLCRELKQKIAQHEQLPAEWVSCGNGAAEIIFRLTLAIRPKRALVPAPTFSEYQRALDSVGCRTVSCQLKPENGFQVGEDFLRQLEPGIEMVFLCQPNNPTGQLTCPQRVEQIAQRCREIGAWLAVDECFLDFSPKADAYTAKRLLSQYPVFVLKAFTKLYAVPGIRLGYGLCADETLLERMERCGPPWSVSVPAQQTGLAALSQEPEWTRRTREMIGQWRSALAEELRQLGFQVWDGEANYLLFQSRYTDLAERTPQFGVLIRDCSNYSGLEPGYYRTAVRTPEENRQLIQALKQCLEQEKP